MKTLKLLFYVGLAGCAATACSNGKDTSLTTPPDTTPTDTTHTPPPPPPPTDSSATLLMAGNIAKCTNTNSQATAEIIDTIPNATVIALGNNANPSGTAADYANCYDPSWGRFKARTYAALGSHEYDSSTTADGAVAYFGTRAGPAGKGYYSFEAGSWHVIVLNSNPAYVPYTSGSDQTAWLTQDLAANAGKCMLAVWHDPMFVSAPNGWFVRQTLTNTWSRLQAAGVRVVVNGGAYQYERMNPMNADGSPSATGIMQFNAGLGGESQQNGPTGAGVYPQSALLNERFGVLRLDLKSSTFEWTYISANGPIVDAGVASCK